MVEHYSLPVPEGNYEISEDPLAILNAQKIHSGAVLAIVEKHPSMIRKGLLYVPSDFQKEFHDKIDRFLVSFNNPKQAFSAIVYLPLFKPREGTRRSPTYESLIGYLNLRGIKIQPNNIENRFECEDCYEPKLGGKNIETKTTVLDNHSLDVLWHNSQGKWLNDRNIFRIPLKFD